MDNRAKGHGGTATSPDSARAAALFEQFVSAGTFKSVLSTYRQLCEVLRLKPTTISNFYPRLKAKLHSWKAASLWTKLDKRSSHKCYNRGKSCPNTRVLIIGAGPCGLRAAIEAQLLGAKVVIIEKRDRFSRNNVLHLWPFVIHDLRNLGAKKFFGKFCAGSIDHISIRQLQIILLKVALLLGVEVHENVGFVSLKEPPEDQSQERIGWQAFVIPKDHPVSQYEFDVLIGADGKRNTLLGFNRKEFRGKLAIAVTANFINRHTLEEARVEEISGVAFIFNQKFFQDMREQTGIDLENIVYYKDDTHYFVMTAKKHSLLDRGVIINDHNDTAKLLAAENVDREALMEYATDAAVFATDNQLPSQDFAVNHYGQADVAMFDFTSMYAAENACRITERRGHKLLQGLVGDSLLEPFWPTGSGCARGFLSSFDAAWMIKSWASGKLTPLQVLAEREAIYRLLAQTTPENLSKDLNQYTLNPSSRYPNLILQSVLPSQVRSLYNTDGTLEENIVDIPVEVPKKRRKRESVIHPDVLLNWCQRQVALCDTIKIENLTSSWKNGMALCGILNRYRPDLINLALLNPDDVSKNNQLAFDICEKELGIPPVMTGQEMADCEVPDKLSMVSYLAQIYETFRGEIPVVCQPKSSTDDRAISPNRQTIGNPRSILTRISNKFQNKKKYSIEKESAKEKAESLKRGRHPPMLHKRRSKEKDKGIALDFINSDVALTKYKILPSLDTPKESISSRVKNLEMKMIKDSGLRCHLMEDAESKANLARTDQMDLNIKQIQEQLKRNGSGNFDKKSNGPKVGRLRKDEWNVKMLEEKISQQKMMLQKSTPSERNKIKQEIFDNNLRLIEAKLQSGGALTAEEKARFAKFDSSLSKLQEQLTKGNLDVGERGHNQVAAMTEHMTSIWNRKVGLKKDPLPPAPVLNSAIVVESKVGGSEICYFCKKRVYLMERSSAEGLFFHRSCFKCDYCSASLRLGNYAFEKNSIEGGKFYCTPHFRMEKPDHRWQEMMKRKQAFLSNAVDEQEKEKIFTTILDNAVKALSPNKQEDMPDEEETVPDSPAVTAVITEMDNIPKQEVKPMTFLEPLNIFGRDQTPERVEYENSILDYSEEELLTSELEEEELTQKNLGPSQELTTSEDEYSDISTDSESDEEAYAEELERSLTADATRKLAERWQRKYSQMDSDSSSSSSSSSDEVSDTEIGSEDGTSDDINSDEEYSIGEHKKAKKVAHASGDGNKEQEPELKASEEKNELRVEVPVIDLQKMNQECEDETTSESDMYEEKTGSSDDSEEDSSSEAEEEELLLPPPQIPTIVIDESPPQDVDQDQEWPENANVKGNHPKETKDLDFPKTVDIVDKQSKPQTPTEDKCSKIETDIYCDTKSKTESETSADVQAQTKEDVPNITEAHVLPDLVPNHSIEPLIKSPEQELSKSATTEQTSVMCDTDSVSRSTVGVTEPLNHVDDDVRSDQKLCNSVVDSAENVVGGGVGDGNSLVCYANEPAKFTEASASELNSDSLPKMPSSSQSPSHQLVDVTPDKSVSLVPSDSSPYPIDLSFITIRRKKKPDKKQEESFVWDSDNSVSLPWFCDENEDIDLVRASLPKPLSPQRDSSTIAYKTALETSDKTSDKTASSAGSISPLHKSISPSDFFTPLAPKYRSTPIKPIDKPFPPAVTNGLLSPISESDAKLMISSLDSVHIKPLLMSSETTGSSKTYLSANSSQSNANNSSSLVNSSSKTTPDNSRNPSANSSSAKSSSSRYGVYSGNFAEKVRPKSAMGDTIYLRTLDINLHKYEFPTVTKSTDKLNDDESSIRKKLFHGSDKTLPAAKQSQSEFAGTNLKAFQRQTSVPTEKTNYSVSSSFTPVTNSASSFTPVTSSISSFTPVTPRTLTKAPVTIISKDKDIPQNSIAPCYVEPASPYTYAQNRSVTDSAFPIKMRPKCDMDLTKLREKREKRKSVHENIQGLPFADEEKATTPVDSVSSSNNVFLPSTPSDKPSKHDDFEDMLQRSTQSVAQEQARKEARARARLKSDEELGLSPKNYRKKYQRQLSLSSIYYDELNSDEFYDNENEELEDELIVGAFQNKKVQIADLRSELDADLRSELDADFQNDDEVSMSLAESEGSNQVIHSTEPSPQKQNKMSLSPVKISSPPQIPPAIIETSSSEASPEFADARLSTNQHIGTTKIKKESNISMESSGDEEKLKASSKKSFFSILSFGKSSGAKDKSSKNKARESERASSLPADLSGKVPAKQKPFSNLKLNKSKDKHRQKHSSEGMVIENKFSDIPPKQTEEPKSILMNSSQAKIIPKYEVYRNPGVRLSAIPSHMTQNKVENGKAAPKASEDSFSDTEDDTNRSSAQRNTPDADKKDKDLNEKEKKAQRVVQKVQRQQELKRLRNAQEIQRRLEELEVRQKELEQQGVVVEKALRPEGKKLSSSKENELMQEWYRLVHSKNQLIREEQELLIRLKDLELEDRHSRLQQEMRERMTESSKNSIQIGEEKKILTEMLRIVEERDELVVMLEQLRLKEEEDGKGIGPPTQGQTKPTSCSSKS